MLGRGQARAVGSCAGSFYGRGILQRLATRDSSPRSRTASAWRAVLSQRRRPVSNCLRHTRRALDGPRAGAAWFDRLLYILRTAAGEIGASPLHRHALTTPSHCILPTAHATQRDRVGRAVIAGQGDCGTQYHPVFIQPIQLERPQLSCSASQRLHTLRLSSGTSTRPHAHCEPQRDARGTPAGLRS